MDTQDAVFVAGHRGLVGSAICRRLEREGFRNVITRTRAELDLRDTAAVAAFFRETRTEYVFLAAARVGGILANSRYPAEFLYENLQIQNSVIDGAWRNGVRKLMFLGSSCIYPKMAPQPIREEYLLSGPLEPSNQWYAVAKIAGLKMIQAYREQYGWSAISLMPTNLYGPGDNFHPENSHVLPALMRRFHEAAIDRKPEVVIWGTGSPRREFLHADDLADAAVYLMRNYDAPEFINVGTGEDVSIGDLARMIAEITGYQGSVVFDSSKPDGTPRKLLDVSRLAAAGWKARIGLEEGIRQTYEWYKQSQTSPVTR